MAAEAPRRIMVVDDHEDTRQVVVELLGELRPQWRLGGVGTAGEALQWCRDDPPDVVLLDYRLPDSSGADVVRALRTACPSAAVIVLTGDPSPAVVAQSLEAGAAACLGKSGDVVDLAAVVERVLEQQ